MGVGALWAKGSAAPSSFWSYASKAKGIGRVEFGAGMAARRAGVGADEIVYWVVNKETGQVMKVGVTSGVNSAERWGPYFKRATAEGIEVDIEYVRFSGNVPRVGKSAPENLLRKEFENQGHKLPGDLTRPRNPAEFPEHP